MKTILIIDPHDGRASTLQTLLQSDDSKVVIATDENEMMNYLTMERFDAILLEPEFPEDALQSYSRNADLPLRKPGGVGFELFTKILNHYTTSPVPKVILCSILEKSLLVDVGFPRELPYLVKTSSWKDIKAEIYKN
jgi:CheY-like chemotaxis protein